MDETQIKIFRKQKKTSATTAKPLISMDQHDQQKQYTQKTIIKKNYFDQQQEIQHQSNDVNNDNNSTVDDIEEK